MDRFFIIKVGVRLHRPALCFQRFLKVPSLVRFFTIYFLATHRLLLICADDVLLIFSAPFAGQRANEAPKLNVGKFCTTAYLDQPGVDYAWSKEVFGDFWTFLSRILRGSISGMFQPYSSYRICPVQGQMSVFRTQSNLQDDGWYFPRYAFPFWFQISSHERERLRLWKRKVVSSFLDLPPLPLSQLEIGHTYKDRTGIFRQIRIGWVFWYSLGSKICGVSVFSCN